MAPKGKPRWVAARQAGVLNSADIQSNRKQAGTLLGADYKTLLYKMKKLGISRSRLSRIA